MFKKVPLLAVIPVLVLALAGCTGTPAPKPTPSYRPAALTATTMTMAAAANYYLDTVCPQNALGNTFNQALKDFNRNPMGYSLQSVTNVAAKMAQMSRSQADALKNPPLPWPASAAADIKTVASFDLADVSFYQAAGEAKTLSEFNSAFNGMSQKDSGAQAVRDDLRLPTNTVTSCYGHPGYADKKPKVTTSTPAPMTASKVIGTYPTGYPKIVSVSSIPSYMRTQFDGDTQAVAVASGVYIGARPGLTEQQVLDTQKIVGLCSDVKAFTKSFTSGAQYPGTCFTTVMVTPSPKA